MYHLHSIKEITSDERKTLTKISTRNLSRQFPQTSAHIGHDEIIITGNKKHFAQLEIGILHLPSLPPLNRFNLGSLHSHSERVMHLGAPLLDMDWRGAVLLRVLPLTLPGEGPFPVTTNPLMRMKGYPLIPPFQIGPPTEGVGVEGATAAGAAVTPMALTPLGEAKEKGWIFE